MAKVRKDKCGCNLHKGEYQRPDGRYAYAYRYNGKRVFIYDTDLASLRKKEQQIQADLIDGIRTYESSRLTLNDLFQVYMKTRPFERIYGIQLPLSLGALYSTRTHSRKSALQDP